MIIRCNDCCCHMIETDDNQIFECEDCGRDDCLMEWEDESPND